MKTCTKCGQSLSKSCFHKRTLKSGKVSLQSKCKSCSSKERKKYTKKHETIRSKLKLSDEEYEALIAPGQCENPFCRSTDRRLCIDHNHDTEKPRGLLCHNCNTALGLLKDEKTGLDSLQNIIGLSQYLAQREPLA